MHVCVCVCVRVCVCVCVYTRIEVSKFKPNFYLFWVYVCASARVYLYGERMECARVSEYVSVCLCVCVCVCVCACICMCACK